MTTAHKYTPAGIKQLYQTNPDAGHFFDREAMRFFGDKMSSFGVTISGDVQYLYRKRTAAVNVFGRRCQAGREFFNCWEVVEKGGRLDLDNCDENATDSVYKHLYQGATR